MARTRIRSQTRTLRDWNFLFEFRLTNERKAGLWIVRTKSATAHSILLETTAYFTAPFRFGFGFLMTRADRDGLRNYAIFCDERPVTKRANIGLFEQ
jgi:hypothetical protein